MEKVLELIAGEKTIQKAFNNSKKEYYKSEKDFGVKFNDLEIFYHEYSDEKLDLLETLQAYKKLNYSNPIFSYKKTSHYEEYTYTKRKTLYTYNSLSKTLYKFDKKTEKKQIKIKSVSEFFQNVINF